MSKAHATVYFNGEFRPLHVESDCMENAIQSIKKRAKCPEIRDTIAKLSRDIKRQQKAGIGIAAASRNSTGHGVHVASYPRDPWLDSMTDSMPQHPSISY